MKKVFTLISLIIISSFPCFAVYVSDLSRELQLQGAYGDVIDVEFEEIAAQTQSYLIGMPFNIMDSSVQFSSGSGRVIARWSILTNTDFEVSFEIDDRKLHLENNTSDTTSLDFILNFTYNLSYYVGENPESHSGSFEFDTSQYDPNNAEKVRIIPEGVVPDTGSFTGSVEGLVYFKFADNQEGTLNSALAGNYVADVIMKVSTK